MASSGFLMAAVMLLSGNHSVASSIPKNTCEATGSCTKDEDSSVLIQAKVHAQSALPETQELQAEAWIDDSSVESRDKLTQEQFMEIKSIVEAMNGGVDEEADGKEKAHKAMNAGVDEDVDGKEKTGCWPWDCIKKLVKHVKKAFEWVVDKVDNLVDATVGRIYEATAGRLYDATVGKALKAVRQAVGKVTGGHFKIPEPTLKNAWHYHPAVAGYKKAVQGFDTAMKLGDNIKRRFNWLAKKSSEWLLLEIRWSTHPDKCFNLAGGVISVGTNIQLWSCIDSVPEHNLFIMPAPGRSGNIRYAKDPSKCLNVAWGLNYGHNLQLYPCSGTANEQFNMPAPGHSEAIQVTGTDWCLDVANGKHHNGANIQLWKCNTPVNQKFVTPAPGAAGMLVAAADPTKCLNPRLEQTHNGNNIHLWDCTVTGSQMFFMVPIPNTAGQIRLLKDPSKCLDVAWGSTHNGANVQLWTCGHGNQNQQFIMNENGTPRQIRWAKHRNKCIDISGGTNNGVNIHMWDCHGGSNQKWITPLFR